MKGKPLYVVHRYGMSNKQSTRHQAIDHGRRTFLKGAVMATAVALTGALPSMAYTSPEGIQGDLYSPKGMEFDVISGNLFVADAGNYCVRVFDDKGKLIRTIGQAGSGKAELNYPMDLTFGIGTLYVLDTNNGRILKFDPESGLYNGSFGQLGGSSDRLFTPTGIGYAGDQAYVANTRSHCVQIWDLTAEKVIGVIGALGDEPVPLSPGDRDIRLRLPSAVCFEEYSKRIFILDTKHDRVVVTDASGGFLTAWNGADSGKALTRPQDIILGNGEVLVADTGNGRILRIDYTSGKSTAIEGSWKRPVALALKKDGTLAVADEAPTDPMRKLSTVTLPKKEG